MQDYQSQLNEKTLQLRQRLIPYYNGDLEIFESPAEGYRMRCEFRIWHEGDDSYHIMFNPDTKEKYRVDQLLIAHPLINKAMQQVMLFIQEQALLRHKLYQIDYLCTLSGELLVSLIYRKPIDDDWTSAAKKLKEHLSSIAKVDIIGRARKQKILVDRDFVIERLKVKEFSFSIKQIENSFTQPNALINQKMITWALSCCQQFSGDLLELYCGAGNFSIPLSRSFERVFGTEISKSSVAAAQDNIAANAIDNLKIAKLSSEEFSHAYLEKKKLKRLDGLDFDRYQFSTVLVDPPRAGLDPLTLSLIAKFENIIYISCNPDTLADNLSVLTKTHVVSQAALFDQFPLTPHIESGVCLSKQAN